MNARLFTKLKTPVVSSTLFFTGIILSVGALYVLPNYPSTVILYQVYGIIGLTFFAGLFSIHVTAKSIRQTVVYLERKKEDDHSTVDIIDSENQLSMDSIERIFASGKNVSQHVINEICQQLEAGQAALYVAHQATLELTCGFALSHDSTSKEIYPLGEGLIGRVAKEGKSLYIDILPEGYITVFSGLGSSSPTFLAIIPLKHGDEVKGVLELAVFSALTKSTLTQLENIGKTWAKSGL